ncbi:MAG: hypothetical protein F6K40_27305 [Okeania sp. SIO3I5]|uniref:hypothetical protein n=1 Tax=Okeania sp. SIO3I5 TaxID=2607805 RepID=UPI0013BD8BE1|nr:hypothetical protein [Okeania sp. SIO3I5]NEQ39755.1 hypothetical protein [Okeania sp. SIO3I5]
MVVHSNGRECKKKNIYLNYYYAGLLNVLSSHNAKFFKRKVDQIQLTGSFAEYDFTDNAIFLDGTSDQIAVIPNGFTGEDFTFV